MQRSLFVAIFFSSLSLNAQIKTNLFVDGLRTANFIYQDTIGLVTHMREKTNQAIKDGYFFAGIDSVLNNNGTTTIFFHKGNKLGTKIPDLTGNLIEELSKKVDYLADHGYPFASIKVESTRINNGVLTGTLKEDKGPYIVNDSAFFFSPIKTKHKFIYQTLDFIPEKPFGESSYSSLSKKISRSPFLQFSRQPDISFQNGKAKLYLEIEEEATNYFQGVLGLQQNGSNAEAVGSIDLSLQNLFLSGKRFDLQWERFSNNSQELSIYYGHPYFLETKITPFFKFDLLRQDTSFVSRNTVLGIGTYLLDNVEFRFNYKKQVGSLLSTENLAISDLSNADYDTDIYELSLSRGDLTWFDNLTSGIAWNMGIGLGTKTINQNPNVADMFYDTLNLTSDIFRFEMRFTGQKLVKERLAIHQHFWAELIENDEILDNERLRIGGLKSLRGFDEKSFFADRIALSRTEFRSFFEKRSYLFLFLDWLWYRRNNYSDTPFGTGLGFSLATLSGQFSFAMAIGNSRNQELDLANMKAHFGYIARF